MSVDHEEGRWVYSRQHRQVVKILESIHLWGDTTYRVWLPEKDAVVLLREADLLPIENSPQQSKAQLVFIAAASRVSEALTQDQLLAPVESSVIPLPHQLHCLSRAIKGDRVRYLLADEVGLGKTIEAGLIIKELKLRGLVQRTLVVAPKGLVTQWVAEMRNHFQEDFRLLAPGEFAAYGRFLGEKNLWRSHSQLVCPMDSVKPLESRKGWSNEQVAEYNQDRFEGLVTAGWDLVIVDEAHRLGGSTDQVARYKLGQGLSEAAPYLLLLSATPHQGKTDAFRRLLSLLDADEFPDEDSVKRDRVAPYVIRTEKRRAIDGLGNQLFRPRRTQTISVAWDTSHRDQQLLYEAVTEYVREGYNQAMLDKRSYIGFLMILMQRLVASSTAAIHTTLKRRLDALRQPQEQLGLFPSYIEDEWVDMDGQEQMETLLKSKLMALKNEKAEVELLLDAAARCARESSDAKADSLLSWIYQLQREESDSELKILVFTEFVPTQEMLRTYLSDRGFSVVFLNGSMNLDERQAAQDRFAGDARILVSTDAGGEGLNLQFCHVVVNYDLPWNPMRIEQRIGRVDRIGQKHEVRALNFILKDSVEHRVRQVLEDKLAVIFREFGIDKTGDVLDSAEAETWFDDVFVEAILHPDQIEQSVEHLLSSFKSKVVEGRHAASIFGETAEHDPATAQAVGVNPLPAWVEAMTVNYLESHGGEAVNAGDLWSLNWPDGLNQGAVVFASSQVEEHPDAMHLTTEDSRVRGLINALPSHAPGQPITTIKAPGLPRDLSGYWSLWRVSAQGPDVSERRIFALFVHDDGRVLQASAKALWDCLLAGEFEVAAFASSGYEKNAVEVSRKQAEREGEAIFVEVVSEIERSKERKRERAEFAFTAKRKSIERAGLPEVRQHRLALLDKERDAWTRNQQDTTSISPELAPIVFLKLKGVD
ncbi:DEAD/DEAH box helicase [Pseudomonadota bacterium]